MQSPESVGSAAADAEPVVDGTQVIRPDSAPAGAYAAATAEAAPARSGPPAGPLSPLPGAPVGRPSAARPAPAADATQAVPTASAGARPAGSSRGRTAGAPGGGDSAGRRARVTSRGPRRARLQLRHIDAWSTLKISLVVSIALFFVWMVAVGILYGVLSGLGVFSSLNDLIGQVGSSGGAADSGSTVITAGVVFGGAAVIGAVNIVLMTALCTVGAVVYNLCSDLVGGVEVTLAERD